MRILLVHERFGTFGGAEATVLLTAGELARRGHNVALLCRAGPAHQESSGENVFQARYVWTDSSDGDGVRNALHDFEPEVIFIHNVADMEQFKHLLGSGIPTVRLVHDHDLYCIRSYKYHPVSRRVCHRPISLYCLFPCCGFLRRDAAGHFRIGWTVYQQKKKEIRINKKCGSLIVASEYMKRELLRNGFDAKRIRVVPPGLPVTSGPQSSFGPRNLIVFTGQIIRGKGVDLLLEALARIKVDFECLIAGDGNHRPFCEERARALGLADRVRFGGFVAREELNQAYAQASVALISSVWPEPFGLVGLESMRFGLPIVGFEAGGIGEWLIDGQNGYLVPKRDCGRFAEAVERLLLDKELGRRLGQQGARLLAEKYDLANYVSGLEELFAEQVGGKSPGKSLQAPLAASVFASGKSSGS